MVCNKPTATTYRIDIDYFADIQKEFLPISCAVLAVVVFWREKLP
jgi:hypothetical protein